MRIGIKGLSAGLVVMLVASGGLSASAAWWKGYAWSKGGCLNTDYWDGFGITYDDWYSGGSDTITSNTWAETEAVFESGGAAYLANLSADFACRNVSAFQGASDAGMTLDLGGHTFSTVHGSWGFFFKGTRCSIVVTNGTLAVLKSIEVGNDVGVGNTFTVVDATLSYPESLAVGRGSGSTGNQAVIGKNAVALFGSVDGHTSWGVVVGESTGEDGNALVVRDGGVMTNVASTLCIGQNSCSNLLEVASGGYLYRENYLFLANVSDATYAPKGNVIRVDGAGSELYCKSQFALGASVSTDFKDLGNRVEVLDGGVFRVSNDFQIYSSGNEVVVSNATLRVAGGGLRLATEAGNGVTGNKLTIAGKSPWIRTSYDFLALNGATLKFVVPAGGYSAPTDFSDAESSDGGYSYVPVTAGVFFTIGSDTTLEVDVEAFAKSIRQTTTIPLIRSCGWGNAAGISSETIAAWNQKLPQGCKVSMLNDLYEGWGQKTLMLTVKPYITGAMVIFR